MKRHWKVASLLLGVSLLVVGNYLGLKWAPPDVMMGDVQRIMYVHVPAAWMALVAYTIAFVASLAVWAKNKPWGDPLAESAVEAGVVSNGLALMLGMLWGKPTWGAYWSWDPRLTATLVMFLSFVGYLALRRFLDQPEKRARLAAIFCVFAYASIPLVWYSVRIFRSLHQIQSSPATVHPDMVIALRVNAFAFLFLMLAAIGTRYGIAQRQAQQEQVIS